MAAVAGDMAAELYQLEKLAEHIEDYADNTTRFLVIGREEVPPSGRDKTSIIVSSRNKPGALFTLLEPFRRAACQPDPYRYPPLAHREVGLRVFYRVRRARAGSKYRRHRRGTGRAVHFAEAPGVLPQSSALGVP